MITIKFTDDEFEDVLSESSSFRFLVTKNIKKDPNMLDQSDKTDLFSKFKAEVRSFVTRENKIQWIIYTRKWANVNKSAISAEAYNNIGSLQGAKKFIENILG